MEVPGDERRARSSSRCSTSPPATLEATARTGTQVKTRSYERLAGAGYEFLLKADLPGHAERVAAEAVEHSMAKPVGAAG